MKIKWFESEKSGFYRIEGMETDRVNDNIGSEAEKIRIASRIVDTMTDSAEQVVRMMENWRVCAGCLHEVRWKGTGAKVLKVEGTDEGGL